MWISRPTSARRALWLSPHDDVARQGDPGVEGRTAIRFGSRKNLRDGAEWWTDHETAQLVGLDDVV
jgi:hypothetical protein